MKLPRRQFLHLAAGAAALPAMSRIARAQAYPTRPITIVVPFPPGGGSSNIARLVAEGMRAALGQAVVIENVGGVGGVIGVGRAARAAPDGYTLSFGYVGTHVFNGAVYALQYDLLKDFEPISLISGNPWMIVAKNALPVKDLKEWIAWLRANPEKGLAAASGVGSPGHILSAFLQSQTGTRFQFVPYRGGGPALQDLIAGHIDILIDTPATFLPQVRAGSIRALAVTAKTTIGPRPTFRQSMRWARRGSILRAGRGYGPPRARRGTSLARSMRRSWMLWRTRSCGRGLPNLECRFSRASNRRRKRSARFRRRKSRSGGRSSRRRTSGVSD